MKPETLYGIHPVQEVLRAGRREVRRLYVVDGKEAGRRPAELVRAAQERGVPVSRVDAQRLVSLCGSGAHQGVAAAVGPYPFVPLTDLRPRDGGDPFLLLLDGVQDPHNLGAILRTALCAGVDGVVLPKDRSAAPTPAVSKASAGAVEHMPVARVTNLARTIEDLKKQGLWLYGLAQESRNSLFSCNLRGPVGLVVGAEGKGLRPLVARGCDGRLSIPQTGPVSSLNASVAAAVALYEVFRQRGC